MPVSQFCSPRRKQTPPPQKQPVSRSSANLWWSLVDYQKKITQLPFEGDDGEDHWMRIRRDIFQLTLPTAPNRKTVIVVYRHKKQLKFSVTNSYGSKRTFSESEFVPHARGIYGYAIVDQILAHLN